MSLERMSREKEVANGLSKLNPHELRQLEGAADGNYLGGDVLNESIRSKAVGLKLAYSSSGRLRADVYKMLRGDDAIIASR